MQLYFKVKLLVFQTSLTVLTSILLIVLQICITQLNVDL